MAAPINQIWNISRSRRKTGSTGCSAATDCVSTATGAAGKAALEQEVAQLVEQPLEVDRIGELGMVFGVGGESHWGHGSRVTSHESRVTSLQYA